MEAVGRIAQLSQLVRLYLETQMVHLIYLVLENKILKNKVAGTNEGAWRYR